MTDTQKFIFVGRPSFYNHKEEFESVSMHRGAYTLVRRPSRHGKESKESSPKEEKGCSKEEEEVSSSSAERSPTGLLSFLSCR